MSCGYSKDSFSIGAFLSDIKKRVYTELLHNVKPVMDSLEIHDYIIF